MEKVSKLSENKKAKAKTKKRIPVDQISDAIISPGDNLYLLGNVKGRIPHDDEIKIFAAICEAAHTEMTNRIREASGRMNLDVTFKTFVFVP